VLESASQEQKIDLIEVTTLLLHGKKTILKFTLVAVALMVLLVFVVIEPMYTAQAVFLPPQNAPGSGMSQLMSQLGSLGAVGALGTC
jgi:tyrosine-protein kinase Etk/Wzc